MSSDSNISSPVFGSIKYGTVLLPVRWASSWENPARAPGQGRISQETSSMLSASRTFLQKGEPSYS
eukprot:CAMPEP_0115072610 /NCGR_PEP_ID=MMETSP0227-20121206/14324_1 /TAXON_ID=89957 /ORGANISM="Polarella glacialis, Strain CCMP 1383" /LENGTH=65 /DNA_ID=CAMNT_0002459373 /DNA_START=343 /DNA_END=540 /DNA_ORIENTATION=-